MTHKKRWPGYFQAYKKLWEDLKWASPKEALYFKNLTSFLTSERMEIPALLQSVLCTKIRNERRCIYSYLKFLNKVSSLLIDLATRLPIKIENSLTFDKKPWFPEHIWKNPRIELAAPLLIKINQQRRNVIKSQNVKYASFD